MRMQRGLLIKYSCYCKKIEKMKDYKFQKKYQNPFLNTNFHLTNKNDKSERKLTSFIRMMI